MTVNVILGGVFGQARWPTTSSRGQELYGGWMVMEASRANAASSRFPTDWLGAKTVERSISLIRQRFV
jgi:hypothetical protein